MFASTVELVIGDRYDVLRIAILDNCIWRQRGHDDVTRSYKIGLDDMIYKGRSFGAVACNQIVAAGLSWPCPSSRLLLSPLEYLLET